MNSSCFSIEISKRNKTKLENFALKEKFCKFE